LKLWVKQDTFSWSWWHPETPAVGRLKQEGGEFEASLGYIVKFCLKKKKKKERKRKKRKQIY
jgi:hypothetical protein